MKSRLGKYSLGEKIGGGSMGTVYAAYDEVLERHVVVKTMAAQLGRNPELQLRFYREARSAARLQHPNIVAIYDMGEVGETAYIVMELLDGKDLKKIIEEKAPIPLERKLSIIAQVADGMAHAHSNGILHRDLKPSNIHISVSGTVKILDFGIAHIPTSNLTESGVRLGTPMYMSPEQIRGTKCDARSDIFSLGIVMYELLAYAHPFREKTLQKTMDRVLFGHPWEISRHLPEAPAGLWPALEPALDKDPNRRYAAMAELSAACHSLLHDLQAAASRPMRTARAAGGASTDAPVQTEPKPGSGAGGALHGEPPRGEADLAASGNAVAALPASPSALRGDAERLLALGREALGRNDFGGAERLAQEALQLDAVTSRALLDRIEAQRRKYIDECVAIGMAARPQKIDTEPEPPPAPAPLRPAAGLESTVMLQKPRMHPALPIGALVVLVLALAITALVVISRPDGAARQLEGMVAQAQSELGRGQFDKAAEIARRVLQSSPENPQARKVLDEADRQSSRREVEVLLLEAQSLRAQRRFPESDAKLRRVLELDPGNVAAMAIRTQIASQRPPAGRSRRQEPPAGLPVAETAGLLAVEMPRAALGSGSAYFEVPQEAFDGCEILLDGTRLEGPCPARVSQLTAGDHRVVFRWSSGRYSGQELSAFIPIVERRHVIARAEPESGTVTVRQVRATNKDQ